MLYVPVGPNDPKHIPVFDKAPAAALMVVIKSLFSRERTSVLNINTVKYKIVKELIRVTSSAEMSLLPILTGTTEFG